MYTVGALTMWKCPFFVEFLHDIMHHHLVGEVILVDNDVKNRPISLDHHIFKHKNFKYLPQDQNIYINPGWNLIVREAKYDYVCLMNDDIIVDLRSLDRMEKYLNDPTTGVIGLADGKHPTITNQPPLTTGIIKIIPQNNMHRWSFGTWFAFNKNHWIPIPEELKLFFGDDFVIDQNRLQGRINYCISDCFSQTEMSVTVRDMVNEFEEKERSLYQKIYKNLEDKYKGTLPLTMENKEVTFQ